MSAAPTSWPPPARSPSLIASGAKLADQVLLINALDRGRRRRAVGYGEAGSAGRRRSGRIWERLGVADVLTHSLKERAFEFPVERAVFVAALHRLIRLGGEISPARM